MLAPVKDAASSHFAAEDYIGSQACQSTMIQNGQELDVHRISQPLTARMNGNVSSPCAKTIENADIAGNGFKALKETDKTEAHDAAKLRTKEQKKLKEKKHKKHSDERKHKSHKSHKESSHKKDRDKDQRRHPSVHHHSTNHHSSSGAKVLVNDTAIEAVNSASELKETETNNGDVGDSPSLDGPVAEPVKDVSVNSCPKVEPITIKLTSGSSHVLSKEDQHVQSELYNMIPCDF